MNIKKILYIISKLLKNLYRDCLRLTDYHHNHILLLFDIKYYDIAKMKNHIDEILINEKSQEIDEILDNEKMSKLVD